MDNGDFLFEVNCVESRSEIVRRVRLAKYSAKKLAEYYERLKEFDVIFNAWIANSIDGFIHRFVHQDDKGEVHPKGILLEVDDVGLLHFENVVPDSSARITFSFWDRRIAGREPVFLRAVAWAMAKFNLHRVQSEAPMYAAPQLPNALEKIGFVKEGRLRQAALYRGEWFDVNVYSLLKEEVESW